MIATQTKNMIIPKKCAKTVCNFDIKRNALAPCNHEKADSCMSVHAKHASMTRIKIVSFVSDFVVLAIAV